MTEQIQEIVEKRIPLFYGQAEIDPSEVHFFIDACKRVEKQFAGKAEHLTVVLDEVLFRLRGRAYTMFKDTQVESLKDFYGSLMKKFLPAHTVESLHDKLRNAKQGKSESCTDFGSRIQGYALDYEAGIRTKYGEANALPKLLVATLEQEAFVRGLHNEAIRTNLSMATGKTLKELMEMADRVERQLGFSRTAGSGNQDIGVTKCQLCDKIGHSAKTCRSNTSTHARREMIVPTVTCRYCKRIGHVLENCAARKAANQRYQQLQSQTQLYEPQYPNRNQQNFQRNNGQQNYQRNNGQENYQPNRNQQNFQLNRNLQNQQPNPNQTVNQTRSPQRQYRTQPNHNQTINELTDNLNRMSIKYIEKINDSSIQQQGNEEGLVEQQQYQL